MRLTLLSLLAFCTIFKSLVSARRPKYAPLFGKKPPKSSSNETNETNVNIDPNTIDPSDMAESSLDPFSSQNAPPPPPPPPPMPPLTDIGYEKKEQLNKERRMKRLPRANCIVHHASPQYKLLKGSIYGNPPAKLSEKIKEDYINGYSQLIKTSKTWVKDNKSTKKGVLEHGSIMNINLHFGVLQQILNSTTPTDEKEQKGQEKTPKSLTTVSLDKILLAFTGLDGRFIDLSSLDKYFSIPKDLCTLVEKIGGEERKKFTDVDKFIESLCTLKHKNDMLDNILGFYRERKIARDNLTLGVEGTLTPRLEACISVSNAILNNTGLQKIVSVARSLMIYAHEQFTTYPDKAKDMLLSIEEIVNFSEIHNTGLNNKKTALHLLFDIVNEDDLLRKMIKDFEYLDKASSSAECVKMINEITTTDQACLYLSSTLKELSDPKVIKGSEIYYNAFVNGVKDTENEIKQFSKDLQNLKSQYAIFKKSWDDVLKYLAYQPLLCKPKEGNNDENKNDKDKDGKRDKSDLFIHIKSLMTKASQYLQEKELEQKAKEREVVWLERKQKLVERKRLGQQKKQKELL